MSALTFQNQTPYIAQYLVYKGEQVVARLPGVAPGATLRVPSNDSYQITASTQLAGNEYTSAPVSVSGAANLLAQVRQNSVQGSYEFDVVESPSNVADTLVFEKTSLNPVTFSIQKDGVTLQNVVVSDSFSSRSLAIGSTYTIYAVINGVTTSTLQTTNPNAVITAVTDTSRLEAGYSTLQIA